MVQARGGYRAAPTIGAEPATPTSQRIPNWLSRYARMDSVVVISVLLAAGVVGLVRGCRNGRGLWRPVGRRTLRAGSDARDAGTPLRAAGSYRFDGCNSGLLADVPVFSRRNARSCSPRPRMLRPLAT